MTSSISKFVFYSLGTVAVNKPLDTDIVEVTPIEQTTMLNGEINDHQVQSNKKAINADGSAYETVTTQSVTLKCRWMPMGSNRLTSPDVRRGEQVVIMRFGDSDKYYWASTEYEKKLRKLETVVWGISATKDEGDIGTPESMYYMEWSSHKKIIHIHTSNANGEPFKYDIQLNTKDGYLLITDDVGNLINLDSTNTRLEFTNADSTTLQLDKKNIYGFAPDNIKFVAGKRFDVVSPKSKFSADVGVMGQFSVHAMTYLSGCQSRGGFVAPGYGLGSGYNPVG